MKKITTLIALFLVAFTIDAVAQRPELCAVEREYEARKSVVCQGSRTWYSVTKTCIGLAVDCNDASEAGMLCAIQEATDALEAVIENLPACPED